MRRRSEGRRRQVARFYPLSEQLGNRAAQVYAVPVILQQAMRGLDLPGDGGGS